MNNGMNEENGKFVVELAKTDKAVGFCFFKVSNFLSLCKVIAKVSLATVSDVDRAVAAAKDAFEYGEWGKMNARERGQLMYRYGMQNILYCCFYFCSVYSVLS